MRTAVVGALSLAVLVIGAWAVTTQSVGFAQRPAPSPTGGNGLISHVAQVGENRQQLTVIDPEMRVVAVYHIEMSKGEITLKSVRNFHWDLQMLEFNTATPLPREIRTMLDQK
jgi:hypothetical protein